MSDLTPATAPRTPHPAPAATGPAPRALCRPALRTPRTGPSPRAAVRAPRTPTGTGTSHSRRPAPRPGPAPGPGSPTRPRSRSGRRTRRRCTRSSHRAGRRRAGCPPSAPPRPCRPPGRSAGACRVARAPAPGPPVLPLRVWCMSPLAAGAEQRFEQGPAAGRAGSRGTGRHCASGAVRAGAGGARARPGAPSVPGPIAFPRTEVARPRGVACSCWSHGFGRRPRPGVRPGRRPLPTGPGRLPGPSRGGRTPIRWPVPVNVSA